jgi:hypothetical protein
MIAAPVQCDVDGVPKGSHFARVSPRGPEFDRTNWGRIPTDEDDGSEPPDDLGNRLPSTIVFAARGSRDVVWVLKLWR